MTMRDLELRRLQGLCTCGPSIYDDRCPVDDHRKLVADRHVAAAREADYSTVLSAWSPRPLSRAEIEALTKALLPDDGP